jgi:dTDP-glucose pyrophosphorylase
MLDDRLKIGTYVLEHFMQWGTPADLEEYLNWSSLFRRFSEQNLHQGRASHLGALVVPMSGAGSRFKNEGYDTPKPLIDLGGYPMAVRAAMDMPETEVVRFVTRRDLPQNEGIVRTITSLVANVEFHVLEGLTDGQARSCFAAIDERDFDRPLTICACDNGALYNAADFEAQFSSCDILVWGATGHPAAKQKPEMFSWIDADAQGNVSRVSLKKPLQNSAVDPIVTGTFSFRNAKIFSEAAQALFDSGLKVNGEYYVDALINVAIDLGYSVQLFTVDHYIGWGTPDELRSYLYWQTCFDKWEYHPYRIEQDERVNNEGKKRLMLENDDR